MNFDIDNFLVQAYAKQFKDLNKSTGINQNYVIKVNMYFLIFAILKL